MVRPDFLERGVSLRERRTAMSGTAAGSGPEHRTGALVAYAYDLMDRGPELTREALVTMICERVLALVHADAAILWVRDENDRLAAEKVCGSRPSATAIALERALVELAADGIALVNSSEPPMRPGLTELCERLARERSGAVCVRLQRRDEALGVLCLHRVGGGAFDAGEAADAERFARFAALAIFEMAERERAERDEVTGMPGRTLLLRSLAEWFADGQPFALACVDFDGLKAVNERLGYEAGNELICAVAQGLRGFFTRVRWSVAFMDVAGTSSCVCSWNATSRRSTGAVRCWKRRSTGLTYRRPSHRCTSVSPLERLLQMAPRRSGRSSRWRRMRCAGGSRSDADRKVVQRIPGTTTSNGLGRP